MNSLLNLKYFEELNNNGITKVQNFLSSEELEKIKNIISFYSAPKGHKNSYWPTNLRLLLLTATPMYNNYNEINLS